MFRGEHYSNFASNFTKQMAEIIVKHILQVHAKDLRNVSANSQ